MQNKANSLVNPQYKFYATLLDAFAWYLKSEEPEALQEFIDKVNRVPFTSEAAEKGTAFNNLVDELIKDNNEVPNGAGYSELLIEFLEKEPDGFITYEGFQFSKSVVEHFYKYYKWATPQLFTQAILQTAKGDVLLYGYIDELMFGCADDIKTTGKYEFPKYLHNWQHIVYPYCLIENGVQPDVACIFSYHITDFKNIFKEDYIYNPERDKQRLVEICERLIEFLELQKDKITDKKVFALDEEAIVV